MCHTEEPVSITGARTMTKRKEQILGMSFGTARSRLARMLLFDLVVKADLNWCHRCGAQIDTIKELSIEHTEDWQSAKNPVDVFFDISKIRYSHFLCNSIAAKRYTVLHGPGGYKRGCRCEICAGANEKYNSKFSAKRTALRTELWGFAPKAGRPRGRIGEGRS